MTNKVMRRVNYGLAMMDFGLHHLFIFIMTKRVERKFGLQFFKPKKL